MKITELERMLDDDMRIDESNLIAASIETPTLHSKWMKFFTDEAYKLKILQQRMAKLKKTKWDYFTGRALAKDYLQKGDSIPSKKSNTSLTKGEIQIYIEADDEYQRLELKIKQQEILTERLAEAVKMIQFRHTSIKNALDFMKFKAGIS